MSVSIQEEFQLKKFGLGYDKPFQFSVSQWQRMPDGVFIGWRVFWAVWNIGWLIRSIQSQIVDDSDYDAGESAKWLIYLTNWSYLILTIQSVIYLAVVIYTRRSEGGKPVYRDGETNPWYNKVLWLFTSVSYTAAIVVTIFYWTLVFTELTKALSVMTHAVNTLYVLADIFMMAAPTRLLHFIYPIIYAIIYIIFTVFYHLADGTNNAGEPYIYSSLKWSDPGPTFGLVAGVAFVAVPLSHLFLFGLYTLRCFICHKCCGNITPLDEETGTIKPNN